MKTTYFEENGELKASVTITQKPLHTENEDNVLGGEFLLAYGSDQISETPTKENIAKWREAGVKSFADVPLRKGVTVLTEFEAYKMISESENFSAADVVSNFPMDKIKEFEEQREAETKKKQTAGDLSTLEIGVVGFFSLE